MADELESPVDSPSESYSTEGDTMDRPTLASPIGESVITRFMARFGTMSAPSLIDKATPEQLDKLIEQADAAGKRQDHHAITTLRLIFAFGIAVLLVILVLCWMFLRYEKVDSLQQIVTLLVGLGGGGAGGFGLGRATAPPSSGD